MNAPLDRRDFLTGAGAGIALAGLGHPATHARTRTGASTGGPAALGTDPFALGIASGDVTTDSVVLWTRVAPAPLEAASRFGMGDRTAVEVSWRIANDEAGLRSDAAAVAYGRHTAVAETGFAVHVEVIGLEPGGRYVYQFAVDGWTSEIGRTRTAPPADADQRVRFAVINCQSLAGAMRGFHFNGMKHLNARDDLDFVVFLGDYIYEFGRKDHIPPRPVITVDDYRTRYGQYKLRPELRELHRKFPVFAVPDDHEFFNDVRGGALNPDQVERFNVGFEVFWEHLPQRGGRPGPLSTTTANHKRLDQAIRWGAHLDLYLADVRTRSTRQSMVGTPQLARLTDWLSTSDATWTVLGTGQPMSWFGSPGGWTQTVSEREQLTGILRARKAATPRTFNPVVLAGDAHCGMVSHVRQHNDHTSPLVATEFVNAPMTSLGTKDCDRGRRRGRSGRPTTSPMPAGSAIAAI
ncbi:alkaline phosphatase D family protein [Propionibacteriaceae bacterium Y1685]